MLVASLWTSLLSLTVFFFVPAYWTPRSLLDLARKTHLDIEGLLFSVAIGGLAVVIYEWLFPFDTSPFRWKKDTRRVTAADIDQMMLAAKSPEDHEVIAGSFEGRPPKVKSKADEHVTMAQSTSSLKRCAPQDPSYWRVGVRDFETLKREYQAIADQDKVLTKMHREIAVKFRSIPIVSRGEGSELLVYKRGLDLSKAGRSDTQPTVICTTPRRFAPYASCQYA